MTYYLLLLTYLLTYLLSLEVFSNEIRYINLRFTYLLSYLWNR